ncbi:MAG TPA: ferritin family protein [Terriglobales bacterium]|nr:ferritin family protein [Terriglobales bacterium]
MEQKAFQEIILRAVRKEVEAATLYETYAKLATSEGVRQMFKELQAEEQKHKKILENLKKEDISHYRLKKVSDLKIGDYLKDEIYDPEMSFQDALLVAIKREENSVKLYHDLSRKAEDPQLKKMFLVLSQEESKHKLRLETEYDQRVLTED